MAPLPINHLKPSRAFVQIAVNFVGPFITKQGRGNLDVAKCYLYLFTCLATRAVHLEMVLWIGLRFFLKTFCRMVNQCGLANWRNVVR